MSAETKKVLEMLAAGKISTEDAERLLDKLSGGTAQANAANSQAASGASPDAGGSVPHTRRPRFLHIKVAEKLSEYGIDFGSLDAMSEPEFQAAIDRMNIHIQSHNGKNVHIYAE